MWEKKKNLKKPPIRFTQTQELIKKINANLSDGLFISYWNNSRGEVCHNDALALYRLLSKLGHQKKIYYFLKSDGGDGEASLRIVSLLRAFCDEIVALVPMECASAATMIALGADQILMGPMSFLTAVDTSLTHDLSPIDRDNDRVSVNLDELSRVINLWQKERDTTASNPYKSLFQYVHPLVIGAVDRAESLSIMLCEQILSYHLKDKELIQAIAMRLNSKYPSHSYPILSKEAKEIGLNVGQMNKDTLELLLELNQMYSEMGQKSTTDIDEVRSHTNELVNIHETENLILYYELDKDWFYRSEERRWDAMNDDSGWRSIELINGQERKSQFHIA